jgi:hypothetical protein
LSPFVKETARDQVFGFLVNGVYERNIALIDSSLRTRRIASASNFAMLSCLTLLHFLVFVQRNSVSYH